MKTIIESYKEVSNKFKEVTDLKNKIEKKKDELDPEDKSEEFLNEFYPHAQKTITYLDQKIKAIEEKYTELGTILSDPDVIADYEKFRDLSKQRKAMEETVDVYHQWKIPVA